MVSYGEYAQSDFYLDFVLDDHQFGVPSLVQPLCIRVRDFVGSRFIRQKYNAEQALAQFAAVAGNEVDMFKTQLSLNRSDFRNAEFGAVQSLVEVGKATNSRCKMKNSRFAR